MTSTSARLRPKRRLRPRLRRAPSRERGEQHARGHVEDDQRAARSVEGAVAQTSTGADALAALIRQTVIGFASSMDDFRIAFLQGQVAGPGSVKLAAEQFARIRPLNDVTFSGTEQRIAADRKARAARTDVRPRMLAFLAHVCAIGLLTLKGMVESVGDPLLYSDDELIDALSKVFAAAD